MENAKVCLRFRLCWCSEPSPEYLKLKRFTFEQEWLDILQIDKKSTDLYCFIVQFVSACNFEIWKECLEIRVKKAPNVFDHKKWRQAFAKKHMKTCF